MATMAIDKGMPIEQVQKLLGHIKIDTTIEYAMVNQNNIKNSIIFRIFVFIFFPDAFMSCSIILSTSILTSTFPIKSIKSLSFTVIITAFIIFSNLVFQP